eukprot:5728620-Pyramimonas_sp.AAC.1
MHRGGRPPCATVAAEGALPPAPHGRATGRRRQRAAMTRTATGAPGRTRCERPTTAASEGGRGDGRGGLAKPSPPPRPAHPRKGRRLVQLSPQKE